MYWQRGDKALANLRLVFADLPRLEEPEDAVRLKAAELLFDAGLRADGLAAVLDDTPLSDGFEKYDPNQPRVPAGSGETSGRWTSLWNRFSAWLDEEVPVYDQDTGIQYGTQSRARAIVTSPLTVGIAGAGALLGGEALLPAAAAVAPEASAVDPTVVVALEDTSIAANAARGAASQARVLEDMGLVRNTRAVTTSEGRAIPDAMTNKVSVEIKDSAYVSATKQVRIQTQAAKDSGRESILVTGQKTRLSKQAMEAFDKIQRRSDLGPR